MFGTIRKHQTWLWGIIITGTIVSFLVWFSPDARWGGGQRNSGGYGAIDGRPITRQELQQAYNEATLLYFLNFQKWPESDERARQMGFDLDNEAMMRVLRLARVRDEKIQVSDAVVGQAARRLLGTNISLDVFVKEVLEPHRLSEADFERFLRNDAAIQQLGAVAGLSGRLIPPREIEASYKEENETVEAQAVFLTASNYVPTVTVTESNMLQWYTNNMASFRVPERVRVSYVEFNRSNFFAEVDKRLSETTNLNAGYEQAYQRDPSYFKDEAGKLLSKEEAIRKMKEMDRERRAALLAAQKANDFAGKAYDLETRTVRDFEKFATNQGLICRVSEPFEEMEGPKDIRVSEALVKAAFALTNKDEAISARVAEGEESFYAFAVKERIPSSNPSLESIRPKVLERYRLAEAQRITRQTGFAFQTKLAEEVGKGKSFAAAATGMGLKVVTLPPFSRSTRQAPEGWPDNVYLPQIRNIAFNMETGKVSTFLPSMDGGFIFYLRDRKAPDAAKMKTELPEFAANMRLQRQNEAYGLWFRQQAQAANLPLKDRASGKPGGAGSPSAPAGKPGKAPVKAK